MLSVIKQLMWTTDNVVNIDTDNVVYINTDYVANIKTDNNIVV